MNIYKTLYFYLFNRITDALELLSKGSRLDAMKLLIAAQQEAEERYISTQEDPVEKSENP